MANDLVAMGTNEVLDLAQTLAKSHLIPPSYKAPEDCFYALMLAQELKLTPMFALMNIYVAKSGRPTIESAGKLAMVQNSGMLKSMTYDIETAEKCQITMERTNPSIKKTMSYTIEQAKQAGLLSKDNWRNYPARMLKARVIGWLCDDLFSDVIRGLNTYEDIDEINESHVETPNYEITDKEETPANGEIATLYKSAVDLLNSIALLGSDAENWRQELKDYLMKGSVNSMKESIEALQHIKDNQEQAKTHTRKADKTKPEPAVTEVEEVTPAEIVVEPPVAVEQPANDKVIEGLHKRIANAFKLLTAYHNEHHRLRSCKKHLGVYEYTECRDEQRLRTYIDYLIAVKGGKEKDLPDLDQIYQEFHDYVGKHFNDNPEKQEGLLIKGIELNKNKDIEGLVDLLDGLILGSDVPFG